MRRTYLTIILFLVANLLFAQNKNVQSLQKWLENGNGKIENQKFATKPLKNLEDAQLAAELIYAKKAEKLRKQFSRDWDEKKFTYGDYVMNFDYKIFGNEPKDGRSLFISMHGGGNTKPEVNDQQWKNQVALYSPKEGIYVAPRAAVDDWNMWFQPHIDVLFNNIIISAIAFKNVDPNKVYIMGYSAGGDGVYRLATRMADRWAAAAMMAGHPGDVSPLNLRNIGFSLWMGGNDGAYNRNKEAERFGDLLDSLAYADPGHYWHDVNIIAGKGHWMDRADSVALKWMSKFRRNPYPQKIVWKQDEVIKDNFYWLFVSKQEAKKGNEVIVECKNNTITIIKNDYSFLEIGLNDELIDFSKPVTVMYNGNRIFKGSLYRTIEKIYKSIEIRGDPASVFSATISVVNNEKVLSNQIISSLFY